MGVPTTTVLVGAHIQHMEHNQIHPLLTKYQISGCNRYVDNTLII
jgi:hypothetical protein